MGVNVYRLFLLVLINKKQKETLRPTGFLVFFSEDYDHSRERVCARAIIKPYLTSWFLNLAGPQCDELRFQ